VPCRRALPRCRGAPLGTLVPVRIGILTGGGDCPGLNAVIRAVVRRGTEEHGDEFVGFCDGWRGPLDGVTMPLDTSAVRGILPQGGTILGSSRTNPFAVEDGPRRVLQTVDQLGVEALVAIGGEDTLGVATKLASAGLRVIGVPKTIDNDLGATDYTFGFDTAVMIATEAIDRLHTTAESHHRVLIVEVMGRHAGWIALHSGIAGGANAILIPERPFDIDEVCALIEHRFASHYAPIVVVAEGAVPVEGTLPDRAGEVDAFGHVRLTGIGTLLESEIAQRTGRRPVRRCSGMSSGEAPRRPSTGCSQPGWVSAPSTDCTREPPTRWWPCTVRPSIWSPFRRRWDRSNGFHPSALPRQPSSSGDDPARRFG
jgi:phosphofructokinase-like protein